MRRCCALCFASQNARGAIVFGFLASKLADKPYIEYNTFKRHNQAILKQSPGILTRNLHFVSDLYLKGLKFGLSKVKFKMIFEADFGFDEHFLKKFSFFFKKVLTNSKKECIML